MATIAATSSFLPGDSIVIEPQMRWDYYEDISGAGGTCPLCNTERAPNQAHACAKPDYDKPAVPVPVRRNPGTARALGSVSSSLR